MTGTNGRVQGGAWVDKAVSLGEGCVVGQGASLLGLVKVGAGTRIEPGTVVYGPVSIGPGSFIGPNVILGFPSRTELVDSVVKGRNIQDVPSRGQLTIGRDCVVRSGTCIYSDVSIGESVSFGHNVMVREKVRIGNHTLIGTSVVIDGSCEIGERVSIQTGGYLPTNSKVENSVFLGPHVVLTNDKYVMQKKTKLVGPTIRKGASIGANSLLMPAIEVGEGAIVGAHSLVMHNVPARSVFAGLPARKLKRVPADWRTSLLPP